MNEAPLSPDMQPGAQPDDPWNVQAWRFPYDGKTADQLRFLLNFAVLAPSGHNTQPWRFKIAGHEIELYADPTRALPRLDPGNRELIMSCGAALFHLCIAMRHYGFDPVVRTFPDLDDPELLAFVRLGSRRQPTMEEERLFAALKHRRTHRQAFSDRSVSDLALRNLKQAAQVEGSQLHVFNTPERKRTLAQLIAEGDRLRGSDPAYRRELAAWMRTQADDRHDGLPTRVLGNKGLRSLARPFTTRFFDWGSERAYEDRKLAEAAPALLVLSTAADHAPAWFAAGQALDRVLLTALDYGLYASFLNQPVTQPNLRRQLSDLIEGRHPQVVLRVGYGEDQEPTPRRSVEEVMSRSPYL